MNQRVAIAVFESLSSPVRLAIYRLLVRYAHEGQVAGEISAALKIAPNNLSFHLKALTQVKLITVTREGRFQRYRANMPLMVSLVGYLTDECCSGTPDTCGNLAGVGACCDTPGDRTGKQRRK